MVEKRVFREGDIVEDILLGGIWKVVLDEDNDIDTVPISQVNDVDFERYGLSLSRIKEMKDKILHFVIQGKEIVDSDEIKIMDLIDVLDEVFEGVE